MGVRNKTGRRWRAGATGIVLALCLGASPMRAQDVGSDCDRLAGAPTDVNRNGPGVAYDALPADAAIAACEQAVRLQPGIARFSFQLARALSKTDRWPEALPLYERLAQAGYATATFNLAAFHLDGRGVPKDTTRGLALLQQAADQGLTGALTRLGGIHLEGKYVTRDPVAATGFFNRAADLGDGQAMAQLAWMNRFGNGVPQDQVKAYVWYRLAVEAGNTNALIPLADQRSQPISANPILQKALMDGMMEGAGLAYAPKTDDWSLPPFLTEEIRSAFLRLRERNDRQAPPTSVNTARERTEGDMALMWEYAIAYAFAKDPFLTKHAALARAAITTSKGPAQFEAAKWLAMAWQRGAIDAALLLAKLHLGEDSVSGEPSTWSASFPYHPPSSTESFVGSASQATQLYHDAIAKGSVAAKINLATLHEIGHGAELDLDAARQLYRQAIGTRFDGAAKIGLLRLDLAKEWQAEAARGEQAAQSFRPEQPDGATVLAIVPKERFTRVLIIDKDGRRVFSDSLSPGQEFRVPAGRNDLLLSVGYRDAANLGLRLGSTTYDLPAVKDAHLLRLDRTALARDGALTAVPSASEDVSAWRLPVETMASSRIVVEATVQSSVYIHADDDILGFEDAQTNPGRKFVVPNVAGLTLDVRAAELEQMTTPAAVAITVDGAASLKLTVPTSCLARIALEPDALLSARLASDAPARCNTLAEGESRDLVVGADGRVLGRLLRLPDEKVQGVIATFLKLNYAIAMTNLRLGGRWDELYRVARIVYARTLREQGPNSFEAIRNELDIAGVEVKLGRAEQARARLDTTLERVNAVGGAAGATDVEVYQQFGAALTALGRYAEAERFFLYARALQGRRNQASGLSPSRGMTVGLGELQEISQKTGQNDRALAYLLAQLLFEKAGSPERGERVNAETSPVGLVRLIDLLRRTDRVDQASGLLAYAHQEAKRDILRDAPEPFKLPLNLGHVESSFGPVDRSELIANALAHLAQVYMWLGRPAEAVPLLEQLAKTRRNIYGETSPQHGEALARVADAMHALGRRPEALTTARQAVSVTQRFFADRFSSKQAAIARADALRPAITSLLAILHESGDPKTGSDAYAQEAFEAAQHLQSSAAALALQAFGSRLSQSEPVLGDFMRRRQDLERQLSQLDATLVSAIASRRGGNDSAERASRTRIAAVEQQLRQLNAERPARLVDLDEVSRAKAVPYAQARLLLGQDEVLINIVPGEEQTYVFAASRIDLQWIRIPLGAHALERKVAALRCGIDRSQWSGRDGRARCTELAGAAPLVNVLPFNAAIAHELYAALLGPFESLLAGKHLLMSLSGPLATLPPHLLVTARPDIAMPRSGEAYAAIAWLGRRHAVTILPSVGSLASLRQPGSAVGGLPVRAARPYIGLGNPKLAGDATCEQVALPRRCSELVESARHPERGTRRNAMIDLSRSYFRSAVADVDALREICPLPETALELACVAESVGGADASLVIGDALNEDAVRQMPLDQYRVIHFATHGLLADESSSIAGLDAEPALVMTPPKVPTADNDGLLTASEIARLKLNADWVVLSACNTAAGDHTGAEALSGLARAFFYAGARTLLASHWAVDSGAAVQLTTSTFSALASTPDLGPAEALRRSMAGLMNDPPYAHPEVWAPFVVIGEGSRQRR
jgi:CHAT domain-containing protein/TPR repeat protein/tetratricopeptide (TPR) repeat protein